MRRRKIFVCLLVAALFVAFVPIIQAQEAEKININKATAEELQQIAGIGKSIAERILKYREEQGPFKSTEAITGVKGIGAKKFDAIKDQITVE